MPIDEPSPRKSPSFDHLAPSDGVQDEEAQRDMTASGIGEIFNASDISISTEGIRTKNILVRNEGEWNGNESEHEHEHDSDADGSDWENYPGDGLPHPALRSQLEVFIDPAYEDDMRNEIWNNQAKEVFNYKLALDYWNGLFDNTDSGSSPSKAEANMRLLCKEWWENTAYDSGVTDSIRDWIQEAAEWELDVRVQPRILHCTYNYALLSLWREEYQASVVALKNPEFALEVVRPYRQRAASVAACHRLVEAALRSLALRGLLKLPLGHPENPGTAPLNANIDSGHWLSDPSRRVEPPFYLWDRVARRTVRTCDLTSLPAYIAVSHTWGRWRTNATDIDGVPWPVPGCDKFDVKGLPDMLAAMPFPEEYVWMDLFCIPQSGDDARAKLEIANQAAIFQSASAAIAWLSTVPAWEGLQYTLELMALQCFSLESELDLGSVMERCTAKAGTSTYMVDDCYRNDAKEFAMNRKGHLQPWFTSLWTLQELCLRPDMLLCDKDWRPLMLSNLKVPIDHIMALFMSEIWDAYMNTKSGGELAPGVQELSIILMETRLTELPEMTPITALVLGDQRYCESRRAEAIMSVVGCTDWFLNDTSDDPGNRQLVLGRYPLAFIQETRRKMGAVFFATMDHSPFSFTYNATLLPFSRENMDGTMHARSVLPYNHLAVEDHPSVATWVVDASGAVLLRKVGVVASYPRRDDSKEVYVNVLWPQREQFENCPADPEGEVELHAFLSSFNPTKKKYALHLIRSGSLAYGIILMEEPNPNIDNVFGGTRTTLFGKLCNFYYVSGENEPYSTTEDVEWAVL